LDVLQNNMYPRTFANHITSKQNKESTLGGIERKIFRPFHSKINNLGTIIGKEDFFLVKLKSPQVGDQ